MAATAEAIQQRQRQFSNGRGNSAAAATIYSAATVVFDSAAAATINSVVTVVFNSAAAAINSAAMAMGRWQCSSNGRGNSAAVAINAAVTMMAAAAGEMGMDYMID